MVVVIESPPLSEAWITAAGVKLVAAIVVGGTVVGLVATGIEVVEVELTEGVVTGMALLEPHPPSAMTKVATPTRAPNETNGP